jgi:hypothetical protein
MSSMITYREVPCRLTLTVRGFKQTDCLLMLSADFLTKDFFSIEFSRLSCVDSLS